MSKGIAIRTILLLLIGVLVVGVVVYLVYSYVTSPGIDMESCRAMGIAWCTDCLRGNRGDWSKYVDVNMTEDFIDCATKYFSLNPMLRHCDDQLWKVEDFCSQFIDVSP